MRKLVLIFFVFNFTTLLAQIVKEENGILVLGGKYQIAKGDEILIDLPARGNKDFVYIKTKEKSLGKESFRDVLIMKNSSISAVGMRGGNGNCFGYERRKMYSELSEKAKKNS